MAGHIRHDETRTFNSSWEALAKLVGNNSLQSCFLSHSLRSFKKVQLKQWCLTLLIHYTSTTIIGFCWLREWTKEVLWIIWFCGTICIVVFHWPAVLMGCTYILPIYSFFFFFANHQNNVWLSASRMCSILQNLGWSPKQHVIHTLWQADLLESLYANGASQGNVCSPYVILYWAFQTKKRTDLCFMECDFNQEHAF